MLKGKTVLVTNDDGVDAVGIRYLSEALLGSGANVYVVAPDGERSATSHTISLRTPLRLNKLQSSSGNCERYSVSGSPADSAYMGLFHILKNNPPDFVFSGINNGYNLGTDVFYSGTFAAAAEAAIRKYPSMAVSVAYGSSEAIFESAAKYAVKLAGIILEYDVPDRIVFNMNYPDTPSPAGVALTSLGKRNYDDTVVERTDPKGHKYYWIGGGMINDKEIATGSEYSAIDSGKISLTPVDLRCTLNSDFSGVIKILNKIKDSIK